MDPEEPADTADMGVIGWWIESGGEMAGKDAINWVCEDEPTLGEGTEPAFMGGRGGNARFGDDGVSRNTVRGSIRAVVDSVGLVNARRR